MYEGFFVTFHLLIFALQSRLWILLVYTPLPREGFHGNFLLPLRFVRPLALTLLKLTSASQALQTIALFGLRLNRFPAAIGALIFFLLLVALIAAQFDTNYQCF